MISITPRIIRKNLPCREGRKLLKTSFKSAYPNDDVRLKENDTPISLLDILDVGGLRYALWCLQLVKGYDDQIGALCVKFVQRVEMTDHHSLAAVATAERYYNGLASPKELNTASDKAHGVWGKVAYGNSFTPIERKAWLAFNVSRHPNGICQLDYISEWAARVRGYDDEIVWQESQLRILLNVNNSLGFNV